MLGKNYVANILLVLLIILNPLRSLSQEIESGKMPDLKFDKYNELSIGAFNLVAFEALDWTYERILTDHSSFAIEGFLLALYRDRENINDAYDKEACLSAKYKFFFGKRVAFGFYINSLAMISHGRIDNRDFLNERRDERYTDFALGFGLGGKFSGLFS